MTLLQQIGLIIGIACVLCAVLVIACCVTSKKKSPAKPDEAPSKVQRGLTNPCGRCGNYYQCAICAAIEAREAQNALDAKHLANCLCDKCMEVEQ